MNLLELAMALSCQSRCLLWAEITAQVCTVLPTCKHPKQSGGEELSWMRGTITLPAVHPKHIPSDVPAAKEILELEPA